MAYHAFISYSQALDGALAPALQSGLHRFARPWYKLRALNVFRDATSLSPSGGLWSKIEEALASATYFIYLASPRAVESPWVVKELEWWVGKRSPDNLLIVLTDGELAWDATGNRFDPERSTALPPFLAGAYREEPNWMDLRWARDSDELTLQAPRFREAVADLAATLHGKTKDEMFGADVEQHKRTKRVAWGAVTVLSALTVVSVVAGWLAYRQSVAAQRRLVDFYVGSGINAMNREDLASALLWFLGALGEDMGRSQWEERHRIRIGAILRRYPELEAIHFHDDAVFAVELSTDGETFMSADRHGTITVSSRRGAEPRSLDTSEYGAYLHHARLLSHGTRLLALAGSPWLDTLGQALRWDLGTGTLLDWEADELTYPTWSASDAMVVGPTVVATVDSSGIATWVNGYQSVVAYIYGYPRFLAASPSGRYLVVAEGNAFEVREAHRDRVVVAGPAADVAAFDPGESHVAIGEPSGEVSLWSLATGERVTEPLYHWGDDMEDRQTIAQDPPIVAVAFDPLEDHRLSVVSGDGTIGVWNKITGKPISIETAPGAKVSSVAFGPNGRLAVLARQDDRVTVWDVGAGRPAVPRLSHGSWYREGTFSGRRAGVLVTAVDADGDRLATGGADGTARLWKLPVSRPVTADSGVDPPLQGRGSTTRTGDLDQSIEVPGLPALADVVATTTSRDGNTLVATHRSGTVSVWDMTDKRPLSVPLTAPGPVIGADLSLDGRRVVLATETQARVWNAVTGEPVSGVIPFARLRWVRISPDGARILTVGESAVRSWSATDGKPLTAHITVRNVPDLVQLSRNERWLLIVERLPSSQRRQARVYDAADGLPLTPALELGVGVTNVGFSSAVDDPSLIEVDAFDQRKLWDLSPAPGSVEQLSLLAQALSNHKLDPLGSVVPLSRSELANDWSELCRARSFRAEGVDRFPCMSGHDANAATAP